MFSNGSRIIYRLAGFITLRRHYTPTVENEMDNQIEAEMESGVLQAYVYRDRW